MEEEFAAANLPAPAFETNCGGVLVTIPRGDVTKNVTKNVTKKEGLQATIILEGPALRVVELIEKRQDITTAELADLIGITKRQILRLTNNLQRDGVIRRVGPRKGGHWEVINK